MKTVLSIFILIATASLPVFAQQSVAQEPLLDHLTGNWILQGTIAGRETTHDVDAEWVLGHEYVRLHETSREKKAQGQAAYEAIIFIEWDESQGVGIRAGETYPEIGTEELHEPKPIRPPPSA